MEPMRPVDYTEAPIDVHARRKDRWWRLFLLALFPTEAVLILRLDVTYWWAAAVGCVAFVGFEGYFWLSERRRTRNTR